MTCKRILIPVFLLSQDILELILESKENSDKMICKIIIYVNCLSYNCSLLKFLLYGVFIILNYLNIIHIKQKLLL